jgi:phosphate transport system substrate-binding protein
MKNKTKNKIIPLSMIVSFLTIFFFLFSACQQKPIEPTTFTLENYPRVDGSTVTIPLSEALAARLIQLPIEEVRPYILHNKTHEAYVNLIENKTDLIFVTSPSEEELALAATYDVELEVIPVVSEAFVFLTHANNPVTNLTLEDIRRIYAGELTNWSQVGGADLPIIPYQRPLNSGSQTGFLELVMKDKAPMDPPLEHIMAGMGELIDAVASYQNQPDALGYSYYYFVVDMWGNESVKLISVDSVYPTPETISSKEYPITTAYYAVIRKDEENNSPVRQIIRYLLSEEGQLLVKEAGYVPIK